MGIPNELAWRVQVSSPDYGDHLLFWRTEFESSDAVVESFLRGALSRNDLVAVVLPSDEHEDFRDRMRKRGVPFDEYAAEDRVELRNAEDFYPRDLRDDDRISGCIDEMTRLAQERGRAGVSFIGRIAPSLFEHGNAPMAEMVERTIHSKRGSGRWLCPYRVQPLTLQQIPEAHGLLKAHTHSITALAEDRFLLESIRRTLSD